MSEQIKEAILSQPPEVKSLFVQLLRLTTADPVAKAKVTAHIAAKHPPHNTVPSFVANGDPDEIKVETLTECITAITNADWSHLKGSTARAQSQEEPQPDKPVTRGDRSSLALPPEEDKPCPQPDKPCPCPPANPKVPVENPQPIEMKPKPEVVNPQHEDVAAQKFREFLQSIGGLPAQQEAKLDEGRVKEIVKESFTDIEDAFRKALDEAAEKLAVLPKRIEVVTNGNAVEVEGAVHWQFEQVLRWLTAGVQLWLHGGTGNGKTHLMYQIAKATGRKVWVISMDETITVGKLTGFMLKEYVQGLCYTPFKEGGLVVYDESDLSAVALAAVNALTSNLHFLFPNGECVERHKDCQFVCLANTKGAGATGGYVARVRMDAATLDRFACLEFHADEALERTLATGKPTKSEKTWSHLERSDKDKERLVDWWVTYCQKARVLTSGSVIVSQRCVLNGAKAIRAGIPLAEVADSLLFKLVNADTRRNILNHCGAIPNE